MMGVPTTKLEPEFEHAALGRIWALVDSNFDLVQPAPALRGPLLRRRSGVSSSRTRPVDQALPHNVFCMKPWTFSEVLQV
jgi:hypothetical protein